MMKKFELTAKQKQARTLMGGPQIHTQLEGGSRSGKTFLICRAIAIRSVRAPGARHAILRYRFNHVKQSVVMDTWPKMMSLCFPAAGWTMNKSDWFAQFDNGSQVWFGGLDDSDKVLGNEYAGILLNEVSQISWDARNLAMTRLAQHVYIEDENGQMTEETLPLRMWYDLNPGMNSHWSARAFIEKRDPVTRTPLANPENYQHIRLNPADNLANLPKSYMDTLAELPARQRKRFLSGEYQDATEGALFDSVTFDKWRDMTASVDMQRICISVDPSGAEDDTGDGDSIGIVVAGIGTDGLGYLLEDLTLKASPADWAAVIAAAYERHGADMVVGETNYGGAMVEAVVQSARSPDVPRMAYTKVTATRGKVVRAEPISALAEKGKIRHIGNFPLLEDELCGFTVSGYTGTRSPNRADAYVWAFSYLFPGLIKMAKPDSKTKSQVYRGHDVGASGWMGS